MVEDPETAEEEEWVGAEEDKMIEITGQNFEEVINSKEPVLIDFWSPGCPPCEMIAPIIEEIDKEFKEKVKVGKVNVRENPDLAQKYEIMGVPTLIIFKEAELKERATGLRSKEVIENKLKSLL